MLCAHYRVHARSPRVGADNHGLQSHPNMPTDVGTYVRHELLGHVPRGEVVVDLALPRPLDHAPRDVHPAQVLCLSLLVCWWDSICRFV